MIVDKSITIDNYLNIVKELIYDRCGLELTNLKLHSESLSYGACSFVINGKRVEQRVSKITPTKTGQFVSIWKRNENGLTQPIDSSDNIDYLIIIARSDKNFGQFIFPKSVLMENGIFSKNGKGGKRGIRVYPPWDLASNNQALKSQQWQSNYFLKIENSKMIDVLLVKSLLSK